MRILCSTGLFFARLLIAAIFIVAGILKIQGFSANEALLVAKNVPVPQISLSLAILVELLGGLFLVIGFKTRWWAIILFFYVLAVSFVFHNFWNATDVESITQLYAFLKNLAIMGGLLYVICCGPGGCSCDTCNYQKKEPLPPSEPVNKV